MTVGDLVLDTNPCYDAGDNERMAVILYFDEEDEDVVGVWYPALGAFDLAHTSELVPSVHWGELDGDR